MVNDHDAQGLKFAALAAARDHRLSQKHLQTVWIQTGLSENSKKRQNLPGDFPWEKAILLVYSILRLKYTEMGYWEFIYGVYFSQQEWFLKT